MCVHVCILIGWHLFTVYWWRSNATGIIKGSVPSQCFFTAHSVAWPSNDGLREPYFVQEEVQASILTSRYGYCPVSVASFLFNCWRIRRRTLTLCVNTSLAHKHMFVLATWRRSIFCGKLFIRCLQYGSLFLASLFCTLDKGLDSWGIVVRLPYRAGRLFSFLERSDLLCDALCLLFTGHPVLSSKV